MPRVRSFGSSGWSRRFGCTGRRRPRRSARRCVERWRRSRGSGRRRMIRRCLCRGYTRRSRIEGPATLIRAVRKSQEIVDHILVLLGFPEQDFPQARRLHKRHALPWTLRTVPFPGYPSRRRRAPRWQLRHPPEFRGVQELAEAGRSLRADCGRPSSRPGNRDHCDRTESRAHRIRTE